MNIIKSNLKWNGTLEPLDLKKVDTIAIHHPQHKTWSILDIHNFHAKTKGWKGVGYGYFVDKEGKVFEGRGLNKNAGVENQNHHIISICFQGDYDQEQTMQSVQFNAGIELIRWLKEKIPTIKKVDGHKAFQNTNCPGKYFPLKRMIDESSNNTYFEAVKKLSDKGIINTPQYWLINSQFDANYVRELIKKFASKS